MHQTVSTLRIGPSPRLQRPLLRIKHMLQSLRLVKISIHKCRTSRQQTCCYS